MTQQFVLGYVNPADAARGDTQLVTEQGITLQVQPVSIGGGGAAEVLIFANIAAMSAYASTSTVQDGQPAAVESNGSVWALRTTTAASDGITVANSTFAGLKWVRSGSYVTAVAQQQATWFIDPQNTETTSSDENSGLDAAHALLTKAEVYRRWGYTWSPNLETTVTVTYVSADITGDGAGKDPALFAPNMCNGASFIQTAVPTQAFTGTLNVVTAKNRATNTPLKASFTTTAGAVAAHMLLVNNTRGGSRAWAVRNTGGGVWLISQPCAAYVPPAFPARTTVDTWAAGDSITGYTLTAVDIPLVGGVLDIGGNSDANAGHIVTLVTILDPQGLGSGDECTLQGSAWPVVTEAWSQRALQSSGTGFSVVANSDMQQPVALAATPNAAGLELSAGVLGSGPAFPNVANVVGGAGVEDDIIVASPTNAYDCTYGNGTYVDAGVLIAHGFSQLLAAGVMYGAGALSSVGSFFYNGSATVAFPLAGGISVAGQANAYSNATAAGVVTVHNLALTAAALNAAAGAAGFGGLAYIPGVGCFTSGATP
jgi:hypothetical protein